MLNRAPYGVYAVDMSQVIVFWNRSAERIVGFKADHVIGRRMLRGLAELPEQERSRSAWKAAPPSASPERGASRRSPSPNALRVGSQKAGNSDPDDPLCGPGR